MLLIERALREHWSPCQKLLICKITCWHYCFWAAWLKDGYLDIWKNTSWNFPYLFIYVKYLLWVRWPYEFVGRWPCTYVHLINTLSRQVWSVINTQRPQICFTGGNLSRATCCKLLFCLQQPWLWYNHRAHIPQSSGKPQDQQIAPARSQQDTVLFSHPFPTAQASSLTENTQTPGLPMLSIATPNPQPEVNFSLNPTDRFPPAQEHFQPNRLLPTPQKNAVLICCKVEFSYTPRTRDLPCTIQVKKKKKSHRSTINEVPFFQRLKIHGALKEKRFYLTICLLEEVISSLQELPHIPLQGCSSRKVGEKNSNQLQTKFTVLKHKHWLQSKTLKVRAQVQILRTH